MEEELKAIKQALSFLLDQENIRQQELNALNENIDALSGNFSERDKAFSDWVDDREFKDFDSAYGEKLKPYSETMRKIRQDDTTLLEMFIILIVIQIKTFHLKSLLTLQFLL